MVVVAQLHPIVAVCWEYIEQARREKDLRVQHVAYVYRVSSDAIKISVFARQIDDPHRGTLTIRLTEGVVVVELHRTGERSQHANLQLANPEFEQELLDAISIWTAKVRERRGGIYL